MVGPGEFPKKEGDIFYAADANVINVFPTLVLGNGGSNLNITSSTTLDEFNFYDEVTIAEGATLTLDGITLFCNKLTINGTLTSTQIAGGVETGGGIAGPAPAPWGTRSTSGKGGDSKSILVFCKELEGSGVIDILGESGVDGISGTSTPTASSGSSGGGAGNVGEDTVYVTPIPNTGGGAGLGGAANTGNTPSPAPVALVVAGGAGGVSKGASTLLNNKIQQLLGGIIHYQDELNVHKSSSGGSGGFGGTASSGPLPSPGTTRGQASAGGGGGGSGGGLITASGKGGNGGQGIAPGQQLMSGIGGAGGGGGASGGLLVIFIFIKNNFTGTINATGGDGATGSDGAGPGTVGKGGGGGGGGGSGGVVMFFSPKLNAETTINISGGYGGTAGTPGGEDGDAGSDGVFLNIEYGS